MWKWILEILKNERGIAPLVAGAAILGGSTLLGGLLGKNKQKTIDPYAGLRGQYQQYLSGRLGKQTPYQYNEAFNLQQPEIEKMVESTIMGKLGNLPRVQGDIYDVSQKYYGAQKAQMQERFADEQQAQKEQYNRLGLASSSPYLQGREDLTRTQGLEYNVLEADIARQGIEQEMKSMALAEDIANQYLNQGQNLGQLQRGYEQWGHQMSAADIERMINEEYQFAGLAGGLLGSNPPQTYFQPNIWSQLASGGQQLGTSLIGAGMFGGGGAGTNLGPGTTSQGIRVPSRYVPPR